MFLIYEEFSPVKQLLIYLPKKQLVYFEKDIVVEKLQEKIDGTQLTFMVFLNIIIQMKRVVAILINNFLNIISIYRKNRNKYQNNKDL